MLANKQFDFMSVRKVAATISVVLVLASVASLFVKQLALGLDFTGGTLVEVALEETVPLEQMRKELEKEFSGAVVQHFGSEKDILIRIPPVEGKKAADVGERTMEILRAKYQDVSKRRVEFVGPQVGDELRDQSGVAMLVALGFMLFYVTVRFTNKFALGAVAALFHDVLIVLGFFSLLQLEFDLTVLAAVLAVIGYSLNDTIVVADRIRENFRISRETETPHQIINQSINQTLSRTVITSLTTILVLLALFFLGGELIHNFAVALLVGVLVGTYSSIYVASNILMAMNISRDDFMVQAEEVDEMP